VEQSESNAVSVQFSPRIKGRLSRSRTSPLNSLGKMEAPPGFEPGMEVLQIQRGRSSCCLVLVIGRSSSPDLPRLWALLDYVWTTIPFATT
jgi:hypothetical protein